MKFHVYKDHKDEWAGSPAEQLGWVLDAGA